MRLMLEEDLAHCTTLHEVQQRTQLTLRELHEDGFEIEHVAGPISCDGEERIPENLAKLIVARTTIVQAAAGGRILVMTAPFIFSLEQYHNSYQRLGLFEMNPHDREVALRNFWDELIASGVIDKIHFLQGWQRSEGTRREREAALRYGVRIHDL